MTLDEAIKHCEEKAKELHEQEIAIDIDGCEIMDYECEKCAREHEQLAKWLKELKAYKEAEALQAKFSTW